MKVKEEIIDRVKKLFSDFLESKGQRKTNERFSILEEIYRMDTHFDVESLYIHMKNNNYSLSRATIYNTIELLIECNLVTRHQFGKNLAQFEKSHEYRQHDHLICEDCGHVVEFCDPRIGQIQSMMGEILNFAITHHSLNLFGRCKKLSLQGHCEYNKGNLPKA